MNTVGPMRDKKQIELMKIYLKSKNIRNYLLLVMGINSNLRISDLLGLKVEDVWMGKKCKEYLILREKKTNKYKKIRINESMVKAITEYIKEVNPQLTDYLFNSRKGSNKSITRQQAHNIISMAADMCGIEEPISCHSLRKTWGYWAWKQGTSLILIMSALNHSNLSVTKRYLGILQEDLDNVYINLNL